MQIKIENQPIQTLDYQSFTIVFKDDAERLEFAKRLLNLPAKEGPRSIGRYITAKTAARDAISESGYGLAPKRGTKKAVKK